MVSRLTVSEVEKDGGPRSDGRLVGMEGIGDLNKCHLCAMVATGVPPEWAE